MPSTSEKRHFLYASESAFKNTTIPVFIAVGSKHSYKFDIAIFVVRVSFSTTEVRYHLDILQNKKSLQNLPHAVDHAAHEVHCAIVPIDVCELQYLVGSRDQNSLLPVTPQERILPTSCGVIWNQRLKINRMKSLIHSHVAISDF